MYIHNKDKFWINRALKTNIAMKQRARTPLLSKYRNTIVFWNIVADNKNRK